jgi:hypothetical protein
MPRGYLASNNGVGEPLISYDTLDLLAERLRL